MAKFEGRAFSIYLDAHDQEQACEELVRGLLKVALASMDDAMQHRAQADGVEVLADALADATVAAIRCAFDIGVAWGRDRDEHERRDHPAQN